MDSQSISRVRAGWEADFQRHARKEPMLGMPALPDLPARRYTDPGFYELEKQYLWRRRWVIAGHSDEIPENGSYKVWRHLGEPILLVRGRDDRIRAFYNTCRHRGGSVVKDESGRVGTLTCIYHCWSYDLTGQLMNVPFEHEFPGLDKSQRHLLPIRCEMWGQLIFINLDTDAEPLLNYLAPLLPDFEDFDLDHIKLIKRTTQEVDCNWKVMVDAFQENYHFSAVHPKTIALFLDNQRQHNTLLRNGHSRGFVRKRFDTPPESHVLDRGRKTDDPKHEITREGARTYTAFPNIIAATAEFQWFLVVFWPISVGKSCLEVYYLAPPGHEDPASPQAQEVIGAFEAVTQEDVATLLTVQASMQSSAFRSIPLCTMERRIYQHQEEIDRVIGVARIPEDLRVQSILSSFVEV